MLGTHDNVRLQPQRQDRLPGKRCERDREREQEREVAPPQASTKQDRDRRKSFREPRLSCWGWLPGTLSESFLPGFLELCKKYSKAFGKSVSESLPKVSLHGLRVPKAFPKAFWDRSPPLPGASGAVSHGPTRAHIKHSPWRHKPTYHQYELHSECNREILLEVFLEHKPGIL